MLKKQSLPRRNLVLTVILLSIFNISTLFAQVKIGTNPTTIEATSNLEVEASTANRKVKVDKVTGQLTVKDGTEGAGKILTSDAAGGASWREKVPLQVKLIMQGNQGLPQNAETRISYAIEDFDTGNNANGSLVTITESGLYDIGVSVQWSTNSVGGNGAWGLRIAKNGVYIEQLSGGLLTPNINEATTGRALLRLDPGDVIAAKFLNGNTTGNVTLVSSVLVMIKVAD